MWQHVLRLQSHFMSDPEVMFSITDLGGIMDIVASLRTTEELLYDLYDYPEEVKAFAKQVKTLWFKAFDKQVETIRKTGLPYNNWMNIPSEKPWYPLQCDFCYMLSPKHFEEFVLDDLVDQVNHMERSIYHLDGIGEIPHLDMLLDIPNLTGIQWVAGDGQPALINEAWLDLYKRIKDKKKNLVLMVKSTFTEADMPQLEKFIKSVDPVGTYISMHCASQKVAEEVLENVIKWTK
jgi:5-methyltetrahydrofolate--homocysteine methyltransferase